MSLGYLSQPRGKKQEDKTDKFDTRWCNGWREKETKRTRRVYVTDVNFNSDSRNLLVLYVTETLLLFALSLLSSYFFCPFFHSCHFDPSEWLSNWPVALYDLRLTWDQMSLFLRRMKILLHASKSAREKKYKKKTMKIYIDPVYLSCASFSFTLYIFLLTWTNILQWQLDEKKTTKKAKANFESKRRKI